MRGFLSHVRTALVTGASGQVGGHVVRLLSGQGVTVEAPDETALDLAAPQSVPAFCHDREVDLVVHCAAYTNVDGAEADPATAYAVNTAATAALAVQARRMGAPLLTFGTDYIFHGLTQDDGPLPETTVPTPRGVYAVTKHQAEQAALSLCPGALVVRTSGVYDPAGKNFVAAILARLVKEGAAQVVDDQFTLPTRADELAAWSLSAMDAGAQGVLHLVPGGAPSWCEVAKVIAGGLEKRTGKKCTVTATTTEALARPAPRPAWSVLSHRLAREAFGLNLPPWQLSLEEALQSWPLDER